MGRAIVRNPQVFLMDQPLSNLDAKLRVSTRPRIAICTSVRGPAPVRHGHGRSAELSSGPRAVRRPLT
jgi:multiple sugar transport system ATP-binding protein